MGIGKTGKRNNFMMEYKLGNLKLKSRVLLAPMLEPNDIVFRLLCKKAGCGLTWIGMTSALSKAKLDLDDKPVLQLFGNSVRGIASFMKKYDGEVSGWDFNLGCPSKLSKRLGHGACLSDLKVIEDILETMRKNSKKPLTVKIRKSDYAFDILKIAERVGVDAVCVHARTIGQGYSGEVDYGFALEVKKRTLLPVIFSGVSKIEDVDRVLKDFDFVMIGRLAIGNPGIFSEGYERIGFGEYLELAKKYSLFFRQVKYQAMNFTKGIVGGKELRMRLIGAKSVEDVEKIMGKNK
ncbi:MAG: tRNA-dihydrouridine synthase family protein [archaeon]